MTSGYVYGSAEEAEEAFSARGSRFVYSRYANPTVQMFEERLAAAGRRRVLQGHRQRHGGGVRARSPASSAPATASSPSRALFGSCQYVVAEILPRLRHRERVRRRPRPRRLGAGAVAAPRPACSSKARRTRCWRSSTSPRSAGWRTRPARAPSSTTSSPRRCCSSRSTFGADVVVYSATKHIDGQGRSLGGAVLTNDQDYLENKLIPFLRHTGPALSPFNAWLLLKGLETLELRVAGSAPTPHGAGRASWRPSAASRRSSIRGLPSHPQHALAMRQMTAGGTVVSFDAAGRQGRGLPLPQRARADRHLQQPRRHQDAGDPPGDDHPPAADGRGARPCSASRTARVRVSVGLEHIDDLREDVSRALAAVSAVSAERHEGAMTATAGPRASRSASRRASRIAEGAVLLGGFAAGRRRGAGLGHRRGRGTAPFRTMTTPGGRQMSVAMTNCGTAGWVSDRAGYRYSATDPDSGRPWPAMPPLFADLAARAAAAAGYGAFAADACLVNRYEPGVQLSLHQDRNERDFSRPSSRSRWGCRRCSCSAASAAATRRGRIAVHHGDVVVWGGPSRLVYHGVRRLADGTHPATGRCRLQPDPAPGAVRSHIRNGSDGQAMTTYTFRIMVEPDDDAGARTARPLKGRAVQRGCDLGGGVAEHPGRGSARRRGLARLR